ncbi:Gmad2 immunoglobulin-like domain-containing protein [Dermatophilaceae bacterium Soc4.6]
MSPEPSDLDALDDLEARLRRHLHEESEAMTPDDRLSEIRDEVGRRRRRPDWLWPVASAAAVALVAVGAWATVGRGTAPAPSVGASTTSVPMTATPTPRAAGTPATTSGAPTTGPTTVPGKPVAASTLPAYFVEPVAGGQYGLVREFLAADAVPSAGAPTYAFRLGTVEAAQQAARLSMVATPRHATATPVVAWDPSTTVTVSLRAPEIDVLLSRPGRTGLTPDQQRLAVQQVVWAVTAGLQQNGPVGIVVASGGPIFETMPASVYKRPATDQAGRDVAPIWIDSPADGVTVAPTQELAVRGQACTFEGVVAWVLQRDGQQVRSGSTKASSGCPVTGSWSVTLAPLPAGSYVFHARERSAKDGSVRGDQLVRVVSR